MIRLEKAYSVEEVLSLVPNELRRPVNKEDKKITLPDGNKFKKFSRRLIMFKTKGCACVSCGLKGEVFYLEKGKPSEQPHFNLYGYDESGKEVLLTKDHIIPKSKGGADALFNFQPMCVKCNAHKADKI